MLAPATNFHQLQPGLWIWQNYEPSLRADLFSSAITAGDSIYIVDPIPLQNSELRDLSCAGSLAGVIVTNANHLRAANDYSDTLSVPIFARAGTFADAKPPRFVELEENAKIGGELEVFAIDGAVAGEIALYHPPNGGTFVVGDALINFEPYGFTFLPRRYCANEKEMRCSLRKLLTRKAERMLFAHGTPILSGASARLQQLLDFDA